jgi:hypothetical protein
MEFGAVAVRVEVSWKMEMMRMKEVGFKKGNQCNRDRSVGQHEVYAIHTETLRLALEKSAGWDRRGWGYEATPQSSKPATFLPRLAPSRAPHGNATCTLQKRACSLAPLENRYQPIKIAVAGEIVGLHKQ